MSIHIKTSDPQGLLNAIKEKAISKDLDTWAIDAEGDFTHTPSQWLNEAWFRSRYNTEDNANELIFGLLKRKDKNMSTVVYAVYHGRFAEMLLTHFDAKISSIELTSVPDVYDNIY